MPIQRIQIQLDDSLHEQLESRAKQLGFDTIGSYLKVLAKADAEKRFILLKPWRSLVLELGASRLLRL